MRVGVIGAGRIGGNVARRLALAGHEVVVSFSRDPERLAAAAREIGDGASAGEPADAASCDVVVLSVPWGTIPDALARAGDLDGRIVIDTTNRFGPGPAPAPGRRPPPSTPRACPARATPSASTR